MKGLRNPVVFRLLLLPLLRKLERKNKCHGIVLNLEIYNSIQNAVRHGYNANKSKSNLNSVAKTRKKSSR